MSIVRLGAAMLADAALTVGSLGMYPLLRSASEEESFTAKELRYQRDKEAAELIIKALMEANVRKDCDETGTRQTQ